MKRRLRRWTKRRKLAAATFYAIRRRKLWLSCNSETASFADALFFRSRAEADWVVMSEREKAGEFSIVPCRVRELRSKPRTPR